MNKEQFEILLNGGADIAPYDHGEEPQKKDPEMYELSPAENWEKIKEITATLAVQVKDLQDMLNKQSFPFLPL